MEKWERSFLLDLLFEDFNLKSLLNDLKLQQIYYNFQEHLFNLELTFYSTNRRINWKINLKMIGLIFILILIFFLLKFYFHFSFIKNIKKKKEFEVILYTQKQCQLDYTSSTSYISFILSIDQWLLNWIELNFNKSN